MTALENATALDKSTLDLANFIYTKSSLKPMSKTLFFMSRVFLILKDAKSIDKVTPSNLLSLNADIDSGVVPDYSFESIVRDIGKHLDAVLSKAKAIFQTRQLDALGGLFNSLLRGKFEAGEGFGTFLTPEEVVAPCTRLLHALFDKHGRVQDDDRFADITGGTGTFMLHCRLAAPSGVPSKNFFIFDQSRTHLGFAETNFQLNFSSSPSAFYTNDSIVDPELKKLMGQVKGAMTNPPFGQNKYIVCKQAFKAFDQGVLSALGVNRMGDKTDPAWLFLLKNLHMLKNKGMLVIVLPNGICQSELFVDVLKLYEKNHRTTLSIPYIFDLPVSTFSLGGTVAKTSIIFMAKNLNMPTRSKEILHIGFKKKGNEKVLDECGNDLEKYVDGEISSLGSSTKPMDGINWRKFTSLSPKALALAPPSAKSGAKVSTLAKTTKAYFSDAPSKGHFHITVQDVDETGTINLINCGKFFPTTRPLTCLSNDVLVSCLNPKIWRVAIVPALSDVRWTCSPEFAVLRTKSDSELDAARLFFVFQTSFVRRQVIALAKGTSSSRQRVKKELLEDILIPELKIDDGVLVSYAKSKRASYKEKIKEIRMVQGLLEFQTNDGSNQPPLSF